MDISRSSRLIFSDNLAANKVLKNVVLGADFVAGIEELRGIWHVVPLNQILELRFEVHPGYRHKTLRRPDESLLEHLLKLRGQTLRLQLTNGNTKFGRLIDIEPTLIWIETFDSLFALPAASIGAMWLWKTEFESQDFMTAFLEIEGLENEQKHNQVG